MRRLLLRRKEGLCGDQSGDLSQQHEGGVSRGSGAVLSLGSFHALNPGSHSEDVSTEPHRTGP